MCLFAKCLFLCRITDQQLSIRIRGRRNQSCIPKRYGMRKGRRTWVGKLWGGPWSENKALFEFLQCKIKIQRMIEFQFLENQIQFLKHKPRWLTDVNKYNFSGLKGMYTSWGFGKSSFWGSVTTHMFSGQWTQICKIHSQHTVMTNRHNYPLWDNEEIIAHCSIFSPHFSCHKTLHINIIQPIFWQTLRVYTESCLPAFFCDLPHKTMYKAMQREFLIIICIKEIQLIWINLKIRIWSASTALQLDIFSLH